MGEIEIKICIGQEAESIYRFTEFPVEIGRSQDCQLSIHHEAVARKLCRVWIEPSGLIHVEEHPNLTNPILENGKKIQNGVAKPSVSLRVGPVTLDIRNLSATLAPEKSVRFRPPWIAAVTILGAMLLLSFMWRQNRRDSEQYTTMVSAFPRAVALQPPTPLRGADVPTDMLIQLAQTEAEAARMAVAQAKEIERKAALTQAEASRLDEEELARIQFKDFSILRLDYVRDLFIFSCYTGLSYSDVCALTSENIQFGIDGNKWIITYRIKTNQQVKVPILPQAEEIINKYQDNPRVEMSGKLLPIFTNQKMNSYLKEIADLCDIQKHLTFHVARHTFATTVTLTNGVPIESVSKMLGHTDLKTTQIYAKVVEKKISDDMANLEEKLSGKKSKKKGRHVQYYRQKRKNASYFQDDGTGLQPPGERTSAGRYRNREGTDCPCYSYEFQIQRRSFHCF